MSKPERKRYDVIHDIPDHWTREEKIEQLLSIAQMLCHQWHVRPEYTTMDDGDIYSVAALAVVRAVDDYDPKRNVKLTTYAMCKANWAVLEAYRQYSHAPRSMAEQGQMVQWVMFSSPRHRRADEETTLGDYIERCQPDGREDTLGTVLNKERHVRFLDYLGRLPERERMIIEAYVYGGQTYKDIGQALNISEARVYQLSQRGIGIMRKCREQDELLPAEIEEQAALSAKCTKRKRVSRNATNAIQREAV